LYYERLETTKQLVTECHPQGDSKGTDLYQVHDDSLIPRPEVAL